MIASLDETAAPPGAVRRLFPMGAPGAPWQALAQLDLVAGQRHEAQPLPGDEVGYLLLAGTVTVTGGSEPVHLAAPAAALCGVGAGHQLRAGAPGARLIVVAVAVADRAGPGRFVHDAFDRARLPWRAAIHGGRGRIATRHLWGPGDFASSWAFVDHAVLAPGSCLGYHYHEHLDEAFVVLAGRGWMTLGQQTGQVGPGAVTFQAAGVGHGLHNPCAEELDFVRVAVAAPGQAFTTVDLADDPRARRPLPDTAT